MKQEKYRKLYYRYSFITMSTSTTTKRSVKGYCFIDISTSEKEDRMPYTFVSKATKDSIKYCCIAERTDGYPKKEEISV